MALIFTVSTNVVAVPLLVAVRSTRSSRSFARRPTSSSNVACVNAIGHSTLGRTWKNPYRPRLLSNAVSILPRFSMTTFSRAR